CDYVDLSSVLRPQRSTLFPTRRSSDLKKDFEVKPEDVDAELEAMRKRQGQLEAVEDGTVEKGDRVIIDFEGTIDGKPFEGGKAEDRKSTRLNSSHVKISYAVFCLKKKR